MARIKTYKLDDNVTGSDMWIGTDGNDASKTKNFSPTFLANYLNQNEVIDIANSIRYTYDTIDSGKSRKSGTLSFATEIGAIVPISSLTNFILSKNTQSTKLVNAFLNILPGTKIILQKSDYINIFGIFKVISVTQITLEPDFYTVVVEYISGYGSLEEDKDYVISLIDLQGASGDIPTKTSDLTNDGEDGVNPFITLEDLPSTLGTLQQVTDNGNTTNNPIDISNYIRASIYRSRADDWTFQDAIGNTIFFFEATGNFSANFSKALLTADRNYEYPNASGTIALTSDVSNKVPYLGATQDVNLGEFGLLTRNIEFDNTPTNIPTNAGSMVWNDTDGTIDLKLKGGNVTLQIGQEQVIRVVNKTATNINLLESNYQAVRVTGAQGQRLKVDLARATNDLLSAETIGLVTETINNNQEGFITTSGLIRGINTTGSLQSETWLDGDILYLSPTVAGQVTKVKPIAPNHLVIIGYVIHAHVTQGSIFVKVDNGYELDELHNVKIATPLNNNILAYTLATNIWENKTIDTVLGFTPANDLEVVHKIGNETITGVKTFSDSISAQGVVITNLGSTNGTIIVLSNNAYYLLDNGQTHFIGGGPGNSQNNLAIPNGTFNIALQTADTIASFDSSKNVVSLSLATYPSLPELANVKGVTSPIQPQIDATNVNVITITTAVSITTDTTSGVYGQHGRHNKISNGANAINIQCVSTSNADFIASYEKIGTATITFTAGAGITLTTLSGTAAMTGVAGSKACLSRNGNIYYLQITNY